MLSCKIFVIDAPVEQLAKDLKHYLTEVTGLEITISPQDSSDLPYFLSRQYALYHLQVGHTSFSAIFLRHQDDFKPVQFIKHVHQIPFTEVDEVCLVAKFLPSYVRKRMIERRITFVIPKVQMYLPTLGMELRPRAVRVKPSDVERFSPATQVVLIRWLLGKIPGSVTPLELSRQLGYSTMSMSRALDELESTKLAQVERIGRERLLTFVGNRRDIWQQALPRLRSPISKTVRILKHDLQNQEVLPAGLTALSNHSMLNEPVYPEYAISRDTWKAIKQTGADIIPIEEPGTCLIQIWCYDPKTLKVDELVDPFSLYLSLQDETDERIHIALEEMMDGYL